jgi:hypothetical protein
VGASRLFGEPAEVLGGEGDLGDRLWLALAGLTGQQRAELFGPFRD